jgi:hypothetical protein
LRYQSIRSLPGLETARHRPPSSRGGYTVIPSSSSMTSPSPRVAARVSTPVTGPVAARAAFGCLPAAGSGRTFCGRHGPREGVVGILWGS